MQRGLALTCTILASTAIAADPPPTENAYYKLTALQIPEDVVLEVGAWSCSTTAGWPSRPAAAKSGWSRSPSPKTPPT